MSKPSDDLAARLHALGQKGANAQTACLSDFDWRQTPRRPPRVPRAIYIRVVSQLYHGELAAQRFCRSLVGRLGESEADFCLGIQLADETRHAEIFGRYLTLLGGIAPPATALIRVVDSVMAWRGAPEAVVLACHILLEGEVLRLEHAVDSWSPCPLLRQISAKLAHDEARHVAFGKLYLRESLPHLPLGERVAVYSWLKELWMTIAVAAFENFAARIVATPARHGSLEKRWLLRARALQAAGLFEQQEAELFLKS